MYGCDTLEILEIQSFEEGETKQGRIFLLGSSSYTILGHPILKVQRASCCFIYLFFCQQTFIGCLPHVRHWAGFCTLYGHDFVRGQINIAYYGQWYDRADHRVPGEHRGKVAEPDFWQGREDGPVRCGSSCFCWMILTLVWLWWMATFQGKGLLVSSQLLWGLEKDYKPKEVAELWAEKSRHTPFSRFV